MTFYLFIYYYFTINTVPNNCIFLSISLLKMSWGNGISETQNLKILPVRPPVCTPAKSHTMSQGIKFDLNQ